MTNLTTLDVAGRLEAIVNRDRIAMGLAPLRGDARATRAASLWSLDMLSIARVAHEINGNNSVSRLRDSGLVPAHSRNIAFHADDLQNAVELLENDDAYHDAIFDRSVTHIGVAITPDPLGGFYAAVELVQIPARIDPKAVATRLRSALRHASDKRLRLSDKLDDRAQLYANLLSAGWQADQLPPVSDVRRVVALSPVTIDERDIASVFARQRGSFGLGVTQSAENGAFANRIFVVLLFE